MCGVLGVVARAGVSVLSPGQGRATPGGDGDSRASYSSTLGLTWTQIERMRDAMAHRGPDGAGVLDAGNVVFAHRRLAVIDQTSAGDQPVSSPCGRFVLTYNGELYNDDELRRELDGFVRDRGWRWRSRCDAETVLVALARWGQAGLSRLRGMYALGFLDLERGDVLLARDPLGIKPLYWTRPGDARGESIVFASEIAPLLRHPAVSARPDLGVMDAYVTTIRTTLGPRTLYQGVYTMLPGQSLNIDLRDLRVQSGRVAMPRVVQATTESDPEGEPAQTREIVLDSIARHLRSDVATCCFFSGGLDSTIIAASAQRLGSPLATIASGAADADAGSDLAWAARSAAELGLDHHGVGLTRDRFEANWLELVQLNRLPLSTPNETAIYELARAARARGAVVALSGEGADEIFAGYQESLDLAWAFEQARATGVLTTSHAKGEWSGGLGATSRQPTGAGLLCDGDRLVWAREAAAFQRDLGAWIKPGLRDRVLAEPVHRAAREHEQGLTVQSVYEEALADALQDAERDADADESEASIRVRAHLGFQRRINLSGLLLRLDQSTMRVGLEGRTPLADGVVAAHAAGCSLAELYSPPSGLTSGLTGGAGTSPAPRTKLVLRRAFERDVPPGVLNRPKSSFPLPFQGWMENLTQVARTSPLVREVFTTEAIDAACADPSALWNIAWPMFNVALWGRCAA
ncbi:MAG: asparagine synthase (glutamine-hydrolyzing) [Planctomycetota bacterium]|nr:asparagine synthase (glutamine-hydrolyzing) [Planctomycetota bacterium]